MKLKDTCSLEESYDIPRERIKKQGHHFANKDQYSQAMIFWVIMYSSESWAKKKAEQWRIDASELW